MILCSSYYTTVQNMIFHFISYWTHKCKSTDDKNDIGLFATHTIPRKIADGDYNTTHYIITKCEGKNVLENGVNFDYIQVLGHCNENSTQ